MSKPDLTPDELKRRYNEKTIREALTFKPQGVSEVNRPGNRGGLLV